jgi:hypothetical protein
VGLALGAAATLLLGDDASPSPAERGCGCAAAGAGVPVRGGGAVRPARAGRPPAGAVDRLRVDSRRGRVGRHLARAAATTGSIAGHGSILGALATVAVALTHLSCDASAAVPVGARRDALVRRCVRESSDQQSSTRVAPQGAPGSAAP